MARKANTKQDQKILTMIGEGYPVRNIARIIGVSRGSMHDRLSRYIQSDLIVKSNQKPITYQLTEKGQSLYAIPSTDNRTGTLLPRPDNRTEIKPIHSAHKIKFSVVYQGKQPMDGIVKPFGRTKKQYQVVYRPSRYITITAFKNRLTVWVHHPPGTRTEHQIIKAKGLGYAALARFAKEKTLKLVDPLSKVLYSHHVVEARPVNQAFRPVLDQYPEEIAAQIGSKVCQTSHKGKIEHEGIARPDRRVMGDKVAAGMEYLILDFQKDFKEFKTTNKAYNESIRLYDEQIRKHLAAIQELRDTMKEMRDMFKSFRGITP